MKAARSGLQLCGGLLEGKQRDTEKSNSGFMQPRPASFINRGKTCLDL